MIQDDSIEIPLSKTELGIKYTAFFSLFFGLIIILVYLIVLYANGYNFWGSKLQVEKTGNVGDFIGGFVGAIWSLAATLLFYLTLSLQRKEYRAQKVELALQRNEIRNQRKEFAVNRLSNIIYKQSELIDVKFGKLKYIIPYERDKYIDDGFAAMNSFCLGVNKSIQNIVNGEYIMHPLINHYKEFILNSNTQEYFFVLYKSLDMCRDLINTKEQKDGNEVYLLDPTTKKQLYNLVKCNFDLDNNIMFIEVIESVISGRLEQEDVIIEDQYTEGLNRFQEKLNKINVYIDEFQVQ